MMSPERYARLPQWAQQEIQRLEADVRWWEAKAAEGEEDTDTTVLLGLSERKGLEKGAQIRFSLLGDREIDAYVDPYGRLYVTANNGRLAFLPSASNCGYLAVIDR